MEGHPGFPKARRGVVSPLSPPSTTS
ncbi:rCG45090 [Rattus norvegicus]|uniref:RCG45090 n=1 Tax=Rattus norvegicus TaxID=10116 RepID=A6KQZ4_RAT|nr:rCG45090 [Rattus norvegicus]